MERLTREAIRERVLKALEGQSLSRSDDQPPEDSDRFKEDLGADSLDTVELVMKLEDDSELGITIPDAEAEKLTTVGATVDFIFEHQGNAPEAPAPS